MGMTAMVEPFDVIVVVVVVARRRIGG